MRMRRLGCSIKPRHQLLEQAGQQGNAGPGTNVQDSTCPISTAGSRVTDRGASCSQRSCWQDEPQLRLSLQC